MGEFFCDTSAIVKRYVKEPGSQYVNDIANPDNGNIILLAGITRVEVVAAIARKAKGGVQPPFVTSVGTQVFLLKLSV